jgi:hypothetical protein
MKFDLGHLLFKHLLLTVNLLLLLLERVTASEALASISLMRLFQFQIVTG